jgi:hypothetical protein
VSDDGPGPAINGPIYQDPASGRFYYVDPNGKSQWVEMRPTATPQDVPIAEPAQGSPWAPPQPAPQEQPGQHAQPDAVGGPAIPPYAGGTAAGFAQVGPSGPALDLPPLNMTGTNKGKKGKTFAVLGVAALVIGGVAFANSQHGHSSLGSATVGVAASSSPLAQAIKVCLPGGSGSYQLGDGDATLIIDGHGSKDTSGMPVTDEACVLSELHVSSAVTAQMDGTTAMQGRQTGHWSGYTATWTYHPDNGLDIIITCD